MRPMTLFLRTVGALTLCALALLFVVRQWPEPPAPAPSQPAAGAIPLASAPATSSSPTRAPLAAPQPQRTTSAVSSSSPTSSASSTPQATRIQRPYDTAPESPDTLNADVRSALVNILCKSSGSLHPTSGSGVIIDPKGIILTNAHVAQYVLLSQSPLVNLSCTIRTGSPARDTWIASVLYLPPVWARLHVQELNTARPEGTGEHDYALLMITGSANSQPLPQAFPYLPVDTRESIGFTGDEVLVAAYPAEFVGGIQAETNLFALSSPTHIGQLFTFASSSVDEISLGGVVEAQGGSSGGAVVNPWGRLIGVITTTTDGTTTASRDLRAVTLSYINTDLKTQSGYDLAAFLQNPRSALGSFSTQIGPGMISLYINRLKGL